VNMGLICVGQPIQAYAAGWLHRDVMRSALDLLLTRNYDLPDVTEVDQERDWCDSCRARVVKVPVNIFDVMKGKKK